MKMRRRWRTRWDFVVVREVFRRERESSIVVWAAVEGLTDGDDGVGCSGWLGNGCQEMEQRMSIES